MQNEQLVGTCQGTDSCWKGKLSKGEIVYLATVQKQIAMDANANPKPYNSC